MGHVALLCGRYEGMDERVLTLVGAEELSIGDYVLSGGELAALVIVDAVSRLVPGVVGDGQSVEEDSFSRGLLDHPHYTRPAECGGTEGARRPALRASRGSPPLAEEGSAGTDAGAAAGAAGSAALDDEERALLDELTASEKSKLESRK